METSSLPPPSHEQQIIIQHLLDGHHVSVDAVAGSGKSTVVLMACSQLAIQGCSVLQITYNAHLRKEVQAKAQEIQATNLEVHTYHSLAVKYYSPQAFTDEALREITSHNLSPVRTIPPFGLIVIDEVQDMIFVYFTWVLKFLRDLARPFQLLLLGDEKQGIYEFRGSDARFLTLAHEVWTPLLSTQLIHCTLKTSYRITHPMAQYINHVLLGQDRLVACKEGEPVVYVRHREIMLLNAVVGKINTFLQSGLYRPDDIFILAPSIKSHYVKSVENVLAERGFPLFIPTRDDEDIQDDRILKNKIVFSSFHSAKGRQRPIVFVLDYDYGYMMHYFLEENRHFHERDETHCPNQVYVACSRASDKLILVENTDNKPLPFLQIPHTDMYQKPYLKYEGPCYFHVEEKVSKPKVCKLAPTDLVKHVDDAIMDLCTVILRRIFVKTTEATDMLELGSVVSSQPGMFEEVSHINGIALPFIFYARVFSDSYATQLYDLASKMWKSQKTFHKFVKKHMPPVCHTISDFLLSAAIYHAGHENILSKILQIPHFDWLPDPVIDTCIERMQHILGPGSPDAIEKFLNIPCIVKNKETVEFKHLQKLNRVLQPFFPQHHFYVKAYIDLIMPDALWELKCVSQLSTEHFLQTVCYAWIWRTLYKEDGRPFRLFNIRNGECWTLQATYPELTELMVLLIQNKVLPKIRKSEADFLLECRRNTDLYCYITK